MSDLKHRSLRLNDEDWDRLRRIAEHMVAHRRMADVEQAAAMRLLIRDYDLSVCPVEDTHHTCPSRQAA